MAHASCLYELTDNGWIIVDAVKVSNEGQSTILGDVIMPTILRPLIWQKVPCRQRPSAFINCPILLTYNNALACR